MYIVDFAQERSHVLVQTTETLARIVGILLFVAAVLRVHRSDGAVERTTHRFQFRTHYVQPLNVRLAALNRALVTLRERCSGNRQAEKKSQRGDHRSVRIHLRQRKIRHGKTSKAIPERLDSKLMASELPLQTRPRCHLANRKSRIGNQKNP